MQIQIKSDKKKILDKMTFFRLMHNYDDDGIDDENDKDQHLSQIWEIWVLIAVEPAGIALTNSQQHILLFFWWKESLQGEEGVKVTWRRLEKLLDPI